MFAWDDNKFVLPTEYMEGGHPLDYWLDRDADERMDWPVKTKIISAVARGLRHAHKHGVIHRDIRPHNIVYAPSGAVKLVNFDLALLRGEPEVGDPKGLARRLDRRYVAPEVWRDPARASEASDIYSLGIVFYELVTGERPIEDVEDAIARGRVPLDHGRLVEALTRTEKDDNKDAPEDAATVIEKMCALDPGERYQRVGAVVEDLAIIGE